MADQNSARPTGDRVSCDRSGLSLSRFVRSLLKTLKRQAMLCAVGFSCVHVVAAAWLGGATPNPVWPGLLMGYVLFFTTVFYLPDLFKTTCSTPAFSSASPQIWEDETTTMSLQGAPSSTPPASPVNWLNSNGTQLAPRHAPVHAMKSTSTQASNEDWTDLLSQVSHELRTPLNAVIGFSEVMNSELFGPLENPKYREYMAHIRDCGVNMLKSAEDTLVMTSLLTAPSTQDRTKPSISLETIIAEAWQAVCDTQSSPTDVSYGCIGLEQINVRAEPQALKQTFINLFCEALKECRCLGEIRVAAKMVCGSVEIKVTAYPSRLSEAERLPTLSLAIARALLELQGAPLVTEIDKDGYWHATTVLEGDQQSDFFA